MKRNPITLIVGGILVVIFALMLFTFQVRQTQVAVVTTFGKYSRSLAEPGLYFRWPWPIQQKYVFDNRVHNFEHGKLEQTTTKDAISILVGVYVGWKIVDPRLFLETLNGDMMEAEKALEPIVRKAKTGVIVQYAFGDLVTTNKALLKFDQIEKEMRQSVETQAKKDFGIEIKFMGIKQLQLPESITSVVFSRMKAERQTAATRYLAEGDRDARILKAQADKLANEILTDAKTKAIAIEGAADAKASEYFKVFDKNPELANFLLERSAIGQFLKGRTTLILDQNTPPLNMLSASSTNAAKNK